MLRRGCPRSSSFVSQLDVLPQFIALTGHVCRSDDIEGARREFIPFVSAGLRALESRSK